MKSGSARMMPGRPKTAVGWGTGRAITRTPGAPRRPTLGSAGGWAPDTGRKVWPRSLASAGLGIAPGTATFRPYLVQWLRAKLRKSAAVMDEMVSISPDTGWA